MYEMVKKESYKKDTAYGKKIIQRVIEGSNAANVKSYTNDYLTLYITIK